MTCILIAEDDSHIREGLITTLESEGYQVTAVANGGDALRAAEAEVYNLVILDVMMPEINGYDVCRRLRDKNTRLPIMMLTAKGEEIDKVVGLRLGADDYVTKPFGIHELLARVEALLRRAKSEVTSTEPDERPFDFGPWRVEPRRLKAYWGEREVTLSGRELRLVSAFARCAGEVLDRNDLLQIGWGRDYLGTSRTLDQHIAQLRKKIEADSARPKLITTVHGVGYRYDHS